MLYHYIMLYLYEWFVLYNVLGITSKICSNKGYDEKESNQRAAIFCELRRHDLPSGYAKITMEHDHRNNEFSHEKWWFSIGMWKFTRGYSGSRSKTLYRFSRSRSYIKIYQLGVANWYMGYIWLQYAPIPSASKLTTCVHKRRLPG